MEKYYDVYTKSICLNLKPDKTLDDYQKTIKKLNEAIDIIPLIIDIAQNVNYNWVSPENFGNIQGFNDDKTGRSYIPAPYFLYLTRALTTINKSLFNKEVDNNEIKLALDDLMYARYLTQFSTFCIRS